MPWPKSLMPPASSTTRTPGSPSEGAASPCRRSPQTFICLTKLAEENEGGTGTTRYLAFPSPKSRIHISRQQTTSTSPKLGLERYPLPQLLTHKPNEAQKKTPKSSHSRRLEHHTATSCTVVILPFFFLCHTRSVLS